MNSRRRARTLFATLLAALSLSACSGHRPPITVGSKDSTEQILLGEILSQVLEKRFGPDRIVRRLSLGSTQQAHTALLAGEIDLYPEYSGAALVSILQVQAEGAPDEVRTQVQEAYRSRFRCEWIGPLGFENSTVMVIRAATADDQQITSLSAAEAHIAGWAMAATPDFQERADGLRLLMRHYRLRLSAPLRSVDTTLLYSTLEQRQVNMIAAAENDPMLESQFFTRLLDNEHAFPAQEAGLVVRSEALERVPELAAALNSLKGKISAKRIKEMNRQVEIGKRSPHVVAGNFLKEAGL